MKRRAYIKKATCLGGGLALFGAQANAKVYLTLDQAKQVIWGTTSMNPIEVKLSKAQMKSIQSASKTWVRSDSVKVWKLNSGDWFIVDQVIGKHENIDIAVGLTKAGKVKGIEVLTYRESYGHQVRNPNWRLQFHGRGHERVLKLDKEIKNISGATLSCRHITDGINRLTHTWNQVLRKL